MLRRTFLGLIPLLQLMPVGILRKRWGPGIGPPRVAVVFEPPRAILYWTNMAVQGYEYRVDGGAAVDVGNVLTAIVDGLTQNTSYEFEVRAYDRSGNYSDWCSPITVTSPDVPILDQISTGTQIVAYSLRKLRTAYSGPAIRVERSSDNTQLDIGFLGFELDVDAASAFAGVGTLKVVTWYDQTLTGKNATALYAHAPTLVLEGTLFGKPEVSWGTTGGNSIRMVTPATISLTAPKIFSVHRPHATTGYARVWDTGTNNFSVRYNNSALVDVTNGTDVTFGDGTTELQQMTAWFLAGSDKVYRDGVELAGSANTGDTATTNQAITLGNVGGAFNGGFVGGKHEFIVIDGAVSDADRGAAQTSQSGYWSEARPGDEVRIRIDVARLTGGMVGGFYQEQYLTSVSNAADFADVVDVTGLVGAAPATAYSTYREYNSEQPTFLFDAPHIVAGKNYLVRCHFNEGNASHVIGTSVIRVMINGVEAAPIKQPDYLNTPFFDVLERAGALHKGYIVEYIAEADGSGEIEVLINACVNNTSTDVRIAAIELREAPPVASFTVSATADQTVERDFTDTSTGAPTSWEWDFGDGETSTSPNPSHTYATSGTYTVTLIASNGYGDSEEYSATVTVTAVTAITLGPTTLPDTFWGVPYSEALTGAGGTGPYTYSLLPEESDAREYTDLGSGKTLIQRRGALPTGMSIGSSGITGTANLAAVLPSRIVIAGTSIMKGFILGDPALDADYTPSAHLAKLLPRSWDVINTAVSGRLLSQVASGYAAEVAPYYDADFEYCIALHEGGYNDISSAVSLATMKTETQNWFTAAKATGFITIATKMVINPNWSGGDQTKADDWNDWLDSTLTDCDLVIDPSTDERLANMHHNTYFEQGGIHNTELGQMARAEGIFDAIGTLSPSGSGAIAVDYKFTAKAADSLGNAITRDYTLTVTP
jgi:PKD repeat protein